MKIRYIGLETEYAIRFSPQKQGSRPSHRLLYSFFREAVAEFMATQPGEKLLYKDQFFVENSGAFSYEFLPLDIDGGLIEGATPECVSPEELLVYQKAQEKILRKALPLMRQKMREAGYKGQLSLIKNGRDIMGHTFGTQENYEAMFAAGWRRFVYSLGALISVIVYLFELVVYFSFVAVLLTAALAFVLSAVLCYLAFGLVLYLAAAVFPFSFLQKIHKKFFRLGKKVSARLEAAFIHEHFEARAIRLEFHLAQPVFFPVFYFFSKVIHWTGFYLYKKALTSFFISRIIYTGSGSVAEDGTYLLSEKSAGITHLTRFTLSPKYHPIFDNGNLQKMLQKSVHQLFLGHWQPLRALFAKAQRMQIGLSESNRCETSEYLKIAIPFLLLQMIEDGWLRNAPRIKNPVQALHALNHDPSLQTAVQTRKHGPMTALQIQNFYLQDAKQYLQTQKNVHGQFFVTVKLWQDVLQDLAQNPKNLIGRVDWVTKKYLIDQIDQGAGGFSVFKKIDIKYHDLQGYYNTLDKHGLVARIAKDQDVKKAMRQPPSGQRPRLRSDMIKKPIWQGRDEVKKITWNGVQIKKGLRGKVIPFSSQKRPSDKMSKQNQKSK